MKHNRQSTKFGFTLIEVLVVVAILVVIAAILFPVFDRARDNARRSSCQSNLKQIGLAWQMYADDCDGQAMPYASEVGGYSQYWFGLKKYAPVQGTTVMSGTGLLQPWLKTGGTLRCPSWPKDTSLSATPDVQSYGYNASVFRAQTDANPHLTTSLSSIAQPAEMVVFADAALLVGVIGASSDEPELIDIGAVTWPSNNTPSFHGRHNGFGNVLWADGHVKAMKPTFIESRSGRTAAIQQSLQVGYIDRDGKLSTNEYFDLNPATD